MGPLLVVGSGGLLGGTVTRHWKANGLGTVVAASHGADGDIRIDLCDWDTGQLDAVPDEVQFALICSAIADIDRCKREEASVRAFNVTATRSLIGGLRNRGIQPVFCSTDLVFEGDHGDYAEPDERRPTTVYGSQKTEIEDAVLADDDGVVLRMSKLYGLSSGEPNLLRGLAEGLRRGDTVRAACDQIIVPTDAGDIASALAAILQSGETGAFHIAAPERFTRLSLAQKIAASVGGGDRIEACSIDDIPLLEPRPKNNSLKCDRLMGIAPTMSFTSVDDAMDRLMAQRVED